MNKEFFQKGAKILAKLKHPLMKENILNQEALTQTVVS